jgi:tRNA A64-2'-O-ribosylphosphate transferase
MSDPEEVEDEQQRIPAENIDDVDTEAITRHNPVQQHQGEPQNYTRTQQSQRRSHGKVRIKEASRARHRLWSIYRDFRTIQQLLSGGVGWVWRDQKRLSDEQSLPATIISSNRDWKIVGNERCGSWYIPPSHLCSTANGNSGSNSMSTVCSTDENDAATSAPPCCYFKSTDGHVNTWDFSLKRLNLPILDLVSRDGGVVIVDSSVRKVLPDSFSRTLPIWACVLNRVVMRFRRDLGMENGTDSLDDGRNCGATRWDTNLYTPACIVPPEEHTTIAELVDSRVETLYRSRAIVHPQRLVDVLTKPLRIAWMNHEGMLLPETPTAIDGGPHSSSGTAVKLDDYLWIVCWNPSQYQLLGSDTAVGKDIQGTENTYTNIVRVKKNQGFWIEDPGYYYTPGAADDHESWSRHLTPDLFWKHQEELLDPSLGDNQIEELIDRLLELARIKSHERDLECTFQQSNNDCELCRHSNQIGRLNLWIGSRRAGRPPECWSNYDAILNVTDEEYPGIVGFRATHTETPKSEKDHRRYYLQLPVQEGKRDKTGLEKWMPAGLVFLISHLQRGERVLVHCAQGKDRSVAVVLAFIIISCPLAFPLALRPEFASFDLKTLEAVQVEKKEAESATQCAILYESSGIAHSIILGLLCENGKEVFLKWVHSQIGSSTQEGPLGDKESVRIALHLIQQDREMAEPSRATMQKVNRFFMSSPLYLTEYSLEAAL